MCGNAGPDSGFSVGRTVAGGDHLGLDLRHRGYKLHYRVGASRSHECATNQNANIPPTTANTETITPMDQDGKPAIELAVRHNRASNTVCL